MGELDRLGNLPHQRQRVQEIETLVGAESDQVVIEPDRRRIMFIDQCRPVVVLLIIERAQDAGVLDPWG